MHTEIRPRKPLLAALMSFVLPGFGQLYNGEVNKAIWLFLVFSLLSIPGMAIVALYLPDRLMMPALLLSLTSALGIWVYGIVDAWRTAQRSAGYAPRPWQMSGTYLLVLILCDFVALPLLSMQVRAHAVEPFRVPSSSMEPGILPGDFFFADKRYNCPGCKQSVERGDIAIFVYPNNRTQIYIKRIIGLPGDRIHLVDREVSVNGQSLKAGQSGSADGMTIAERSGERQWQVLWKPETAPFPDMEIVVPPGQVFVLGDNRGNSVDSRNFSTVPLSDVAGKARQIWFSTGKEGVRWSRLGKVLE
jgi:signal peptidase I